MARPNRYTRMDHLADLLAEGLTIPAASEAMNLKRNVVDQMFSRMRKNLGWQAR